MTLEETLVYSIKPNLSNTIHLARFALSSLGGFSASLFPKHPSFPDLDLVRVSWRMRCLLSLLPDLAVDAVPSAGYVFAPLCSLISYLLPIYPSRCTSNKTSPLTHFIIHINSGMSHVIPMLLCEWL